jgi:di/tricarboxylate transporter
VQVTLEQGIFLTILVAALALFISEKLRVDLVAMLAMLALALTGLLEPREGLSGFASEPAIIVASVFVLSAGLAATGITERVGSVIAHAAGSNEWRATRVDGFTSTARRPR